MLILPLNSGACQYKNGIYSPQARRKTKRFFGKKKQKPAQKQLRLNIFSEISEQKKRTFRLKSAQKVNIALHLNPQVLPRVKNQSCLAASLAFPSGGRWILRSKRRMRCYKAFVTEKSSQDI
jgi:hypothetical protein